MMINMCSALVFCLIIGLALGTDASAWKDNKEYIYKIHGRTLASLEIANEFSGILLKASLRLQTRPDGKLQGLIVNSQYSQIHSELSGGWMTYIPNHELSWKPLEMSRKPFQIEMKHGAITDLIVGKGIPNWEANMIRGIISQFQININEASSHIARKDNRQDSAVFRVYEETVSGNSDTYYKVNPIPEYKLLSEDLPDFQLLEDDQNQVLEVIKHKNYTDSIELPSYFYGFGNVNSEDAATNVLGKFFLRNTFTRALITGNIKKFTIQDVFTRNEIIVHPTLGDKQTGAVYTSWNATLQEVKSQEQIIDDPASPVRLGGLVYSYSKPCAKTNEVQERNSNENSIPLDRPAMQRLNPTLFSAFKASEYKQDQPQINEAPETPFLPFTVGNKGRAFKMDVNIVESVVKLAKVIGEDLQDPRRTLHDITFDKFLTLTALLRTMDESELRRVSKELYTTSQYGSKYSTWTVFRDAVAESGHGPALLLIQSWIEVKNIQHEEASHIISTMASSVHYPTTQYIKTFFELIKKPVVAAEWPLNETSILSFSDLVRNVYFEEKYFKTQFPVNSFKHLKDKEGLRYVKESIIPYFGDHLEKAILQGETNKIHTYIRALGYIGTPEILKFYEPYLEGKKHCSQFQRALMIVSMDRLVKTYTKVARSVLFKVYQNVAESSEVRVAAVFQLMRTAPKVEMLQLMASYTKIDTDEQVNAVVKSSIQTAASLEGNEFKALRDAAEMAKSLLTEKNYGVQQGGNFLKSYFVDQLNLHYKETMQVWGSDWQFIPNGFKYALRSNIHGMRNQIVNIQSLITSVKQLSLQNLTKSYEQEKKEKQNSHESQQYPWSSQNIARILNMKSDVREQLEGSIFFMALNTPYKMISFDNRTLNQLPEFIKKWEEKLKNEQEFNIVKFVDGEHKIMAIPNEMGLPFVFTYNAPKFLKLNGKLRAISNPQLFENGKIQMPENIEVKLNVSVTFASKVRGHISIITPFDNQQYISGVDKIFQAHVPFSSHVEFNVKNNELKLEIEPREHHSGAHLIHYSTWPYTARKNIMDLNTITTQHHKQIIRPSGMRRMQHKFGKKQTGLALQLEMEHERSTIDMSDIRVFCDHGLVYGLENIWNDAQIQYSHINVTYLPEESSTDKVVMHLRYQNEYKKQGGEQSLNWQEVIEANEPSSRQRILMAGAAFGIHNVKSYAIDASVNFEGQKNIEYILSGAYSTSNVDAKSRVYGLCKKDDQHGDTFKMTFQSVNEVPNTNSINLQDILRSEPKAHSAMEFRFKSGNEEAKISSNVELSRSEERKQYLKEQAMYQQCVHDGRLGNNQSPACVNMTIEANLLDRVDMDMKYKNINPAVENFIETVYSHLQYVNYPSLSFKKGSVPKSQIKFQARLDRDLKYVNVSVNTQEQDVTFTDIALNEYAKRIFAVHPTFGVTTRALSKALEIDPFLKVCVIDRTQVTTFNNLTYPVDVSKYWTVLAQYVPKTGLIVEEQLKEESRNYVMLVRKHEETEGKEIKIVLSAPETKFKVIDITMSPSQQDSETKGIVKINGKQEEIRKTESYDIEDGYVQIYALPNGEIKLIVSGKFYVIYDGKRAKVGTLNGFLRDSTRGLCGQFNDQLNDDFITSQNCYARGQKFIKSYEVEGSEGKQIRQALESDTDNCLKKTMPLYIDVIREQDMKNTDQWEDQQGDDCTRYQTKYIIQTNEVCFTTRIMPNCKSHCQAQGYITKTVSAHCIPNSSVAQLWRKQIDNGASPDFSQKHENRKLQLEVPISCSS